MGPPPSPRAQKDGSTTVVSLRLSLLLGIPWQSRCWSFYCDGQGSICRRKKKKITLHPRRKTKVQRKPEVFPSQKPDVRQERWLEARSETGREMGCGSTNAFPRSDQYARDSALWNPRLSASSTCRGPQPLPVSANEATDNSAPIGSQVWGARNRV